ncbi:BspA family leucine-rich repeat surface protein [Rasiella sp. SM2506]|uniref:BspA family leucine-rich repeat surface protein n=1 Tax=Rasiella sp. SM2506 TaxID=3423914 RepID=UPI003D79F27B
MRKTTQVSYYVSAFFFLFFLAEGLAQDFITTWETTSPSETITIPTAPGETYLYDVDWDNNGTFDDLGITADAMHTYPVAGVHTVAVRGTFPRIFFNNAGDKDKIISVEAWGTNAWTSMANAFDGCSNLNITATDVPDLSLVTNMISMFKNATSFNALIGGWNITNVQNMEQFFNGVTLSEENYEHILMGWSAQTVQNEVTFDAGNTSTYCFGVEGKEILATTFMWNIIDGGLDCSDEFITLWKTDNPGTSANDAINIPTTGAGYDYSVDWGDNAMDSNLMGDGAHTYPMAGTYKVKIRGDFPRIFFNGGGDKDKITSVVQWGSNAWTSMENAFDGCSNIAISAIDEPNLTGVTALSFMFQDAVNLSINNNIGSWDVSTITAMDGMFANVTLPTSIYDALLVGWEAQTLQTNVSFDAGNSEYCAGATAKTDIETNDTWSITDGGEVCVTDFVTIWQTNNPGTSMSNQITIPTTDTGYDYTVDWGDGNTDMNVMGDITHTYATEGRYIVTISGDFPRIYFNDGGDKEKILAVDNWGTNPWTSMEAAFFGCKNLRVNAFDAPDLTGVLSLAQLFKGAISFNDPINSWDVSTIETLAETFNEATSFNQDLSSWVTTSVTSMEATFSQSAFNQPIGGWDVSSVTTMESMFAETPFNQPLDLWLTLLVTNMDSMFASAVNFDQDISLWDVTGVTNMQGMFLNARSFNQNISPWVVLTVTTMEGMFSSAESFNQPIGVWLVDSVTNMSGMFTNAFSFNQDIGAWNVAMVTDMSNMFNGAEVFNQDLNLWDVGQVTNMSFMFAGAEAFNEDISGWVPSSVMTMDNMFNDAGVFNQDISGWDVTMVTTMEEMFTAAEAFDQDLGSWDITSVSTMDNMFTGVTLSIPNYDALLIGWNAQIVQNGVLFNGGNSKYCAGETARGELIANSSWMLIDGGAEDIPPVPDTATLPAITSECAVTSLTLPTATDVCAGVISATTPSATFPITNQGANTVVWTYDDGNGNTVVQTQTVTITDTTAPSITTIANITMNSDLGMCGANVNFTPPVATDNCAFTLVSTHAPNSFFPIGETIVIYTATDTAGNFAQSSFSITVSDNELPTFTACPASFTVEAEPGSCGAVVSTAEGYVPPTALDNCNVNVVSTHNPGQFFPVGVTTVTYTASDSSGNLGMCSFNITVVDNVSPVFTGCPANITVNNDTGVCTAAVVYNAPTASDNCSASITSTHTSGDTFPSGVTTVSYTAMDPAGNTVTCSFTVTVLDIETPVISSCPIDITQNTDAGTCSATVSWTPPLQTDNCNATLITTHNPGEVFAAGVTTVIYTATDAAGNADTCSFTVTITENEAPVISNCPANISVPNQAGDCGTLVSFTPPSQTDNCGANLTSTHLPGDYFPVGTTTVHYTATDTSGNTATCSFVVTVLDTEDPTFISCPADIVVANDLGSCDALVSWAPPVSSDNCSVVVTASHTPGDEFQLGDTLVTYTAMDPSGNSVVCSFTITVTDAEMPVITDCPSNLVMGNDFGDCDANVSWTPPVASDNCVNLTFTTSHNSGDMFSVGVTTVTYTATDVVGNISTCSFTVTVEDTEIPDINCPTDSSVFVPLEEAYEVPDYVAEGLIVIADNCTTTLANIIQTPAPGTMLTAGSYPISVIVNDNALNEATCTFILSVEAILETPEFELDKASVILFPSPAISIVNIETPLGVQVEKITIYDISGRIIKAENFSASKIAIDISELASATYLVTVQTNFGTLTKQLIKE